jgi:hypothetical protein
VCPVCALLRENQVLSWIKAGVGAAVLVTSVPRGGSLGLAAMDVFPRWSVQAQTWLSAEQGPVSRDLL